MTRRPPPPGHYHHRNIDGVNFQPETMNLVNNLSLWITINFFSIQQKRVINPGLRIVYSWLGPNRIIKLLFPRPRFWTVPIMCHWIEVSLEVCGDSSGSSRPGVEELDEWLGQERPSSQQPFWQQEWGTDFNGWNIFYVHSLSLLGREGGEWTEWNTIV